MDWSHGEGAAVGLFSKHANNEPEKLLNKTMLASLGKQCGLVLKHYSRFLLGANQLAVFSKVVKQQLKQRLFKYIYSSFTYQCKSRYCSSI